MSTDVAAGTVSIHRTESHARMSMVGPQCLTNTEDKLVSKLKTGEETAFETVVAQQHGALIRTAMSYVADRATAEEVVQETWMAVMNGLNSFEGRSSLQAWIRAILIHKAKDRGVREKRHVTFSHVEVQDENHHRAVGPSRFRSSREWAGRSALPLQLRDDRTPEKLLASKQTMACIQRAIEALPALLKEVLILRDAHGVETKEVCKRLNISETNLYVRLHRARERVRVAVETALG
jgi:RNA polymerase sigma-70 factor, ECF subfamily